MGRQLYISMEKAFVHFRLEVGWRICEMPSLAVQFMTSHLIRAHTFITYNFKMFQFLEY